MAKDLLTRESLTYLLTKLKFWIESLNFVIDEDYIHIDNNYSDEDKSKLESIPSITLEDVDSWNNVLIVKATLSGTNTYTADKTAEEIYQAHEDGKLVVLCITSFETLHIISQLVRVTKLNNEYKVLYIGMLANSEENANQILYNLVQEGNIITKYNSELVTSDYVQNVLSGKADKIPTASEGNIVVFDSEGNISDSNVKLTNVPVEHDYSKAYLTFIAKSEGTFIFNGSTSNDITNTLSYSRDDGNTWSELAQIIEINVVPEDKILWKGETTPIANNGIGSFEGTALFDILGNIMSLLYSDDFVWKTSLYGKSYAFYKLLLTTKVIDASNLLLPATTLSYKCYHGLFYYCSLLIKVPYLPATTLANYCYQNMFKGCSSLVIVPSILPATTLAEFCYDSMFAECTSLIKTPELIATVMKYSCYLAMFYKCTSLVTPPELPATILETNCYNSMFSSCSALTKAPELIVNNLATRCYTFMFQGCTSLSYIKALFTNTPSDSYTNSWVSNVANTGIFIKSNNATWNVVGNNGVPANWQVYSEAEYELVRLYQLLDKADKDLNAVEGNIAIFNSEGNPVDSGKPFPFTYSNLYLTFEALEDGTFNFLPYNNNDIYYSKDGKNWTKGNSVEVLTGDKVMWKGMMIPLEIDHSGGIGTFGSGEDANPSVTTISYKAYGNVMSLLYGDDFIGKTELVGNWTFNCLFRKTKITESHNIIIPATTLTSHCYWKMFKQCTEMVSMPNLVATTLSDRCYSQMFAQCSSLTDNIPSILPVMELSYECYGNMFLYCTSLVVAPKLPATTLANSCYASMFQGCSNLEVAPELPATTLTAVCYYHMFDGCSKLNFIKCLATNKSASNCCAAWVKNVAATGTFIKADNVTWGVGQSGTPSGWNIYSESEWEVVRHYELGSYYTKPNGGIPMTDLSEEVLEAISSGGGGGEENVIESIKVNNVELTITSKTVNISVPTKVSDLSNDSGFITTETDPTIYAWAKAANKPIYTASEVGALSTSTKLADLEDDSAHRTVSDTEKNAWNAKLDSISNLLDIIDGAALGATALQSHLDISGKLDLLVSGENIKTINNQSLLGEGNLTIRGGEGGDENIIESISVNNVSQTVDSNKNVNITVPTSTSDLTNDSGFLTEHQDISGKQDLISDLDTIRSGAALGATALQSHQDLSGKQDVISDLDTIRSGAALGATALQEHQTLKTINNLSIVGSGNITVKGGEGGGEENVIEIIKVNNVALTVDSSKAVNISVPTSTSDLTNNSGFLTQHLDISGKLDKVSSSTTNAVPKFSNTTGSIQNSEVTIDSNNKLTATAFIKSGGASTLFLKADGSVDSNTYLTSADLSSILDRLTALENMFNITSIL